MHERHRVEATFIIHVYYCTGARLGAPFTGGFRYKVLTLLELAGQDKWGWMFQWQKHFQILRLCWSCWDVRSRFHAARGDMVARDEDGFKGPGPSQRGEYNMKAATELPAREIALAALLP